MSAGSGEPRHVLRREDATFTHENDPRRYAGGQPFRDGEVRLEGAETAVVDSDEIGTDGQGPLELRLVVDLDQRVETEPFGVLAQSREILVGERRHDEQHRVGPSDPRLVELIGVDHEVLAQQRQLDGVALNDAVAKGRISAPIVIGRDHLDSGSVASPYRETEGMKDGTDAVADWPILNALLNAVNGAAWVSVHHGGGVGMGLSIHAGLAVVADGTAESESKLRRCLTGDPGMGIARHVDAGYDIARESATRQGVQIPFLKD